jgi:hypothetical protein
MMILKNFMRTILGYSFGSGEIANAAILQWFADAAKIIEQSVQA